MKQPTMQMIADQAGVSLMTVSRALKNNPRLPLSTRERIQKIATELGYRPNPLVSALMAQIRNARAPKVWPTIAFLTAHPDEVYTHAHTYNAQIHSGAVERAAMLGYKLERFSLAEPGMTGARMRGMLHARGIPGVILPPLPDPIPAIAFDWSQFACATVGYSYTTPALHRAANDQFNTIRMAVRRLTELGYQRIGLAIRHEDDQRVENKWAGGFLSFHPYLPARRRLPVFLWHYTQNRPQTRTHTHAGEEGWEDWEGSGEQPTGFGNWFARHRPDAIISLQPLMIRAWLTSLATRVPDDVALVSLNLQSNQSGFSGIDQNNALLGAAAVELVVEQIHHNEHGVPARAKTVMIMGDWVDGKTTCTR
ncbi:LacI family transcriptional regulator [Opitutaceae bacterium TAV4]|nr:LacI family transcriptional regulator [Opitutaceae bacterium TAV4]RRK01767.1 LacI family transcriptional regulator [Opitutaceae bacterium TAV3]